MQILIPFCSSLHLVFSSPAIDRQAGGFVFFALTAACDVGSAFPFVTVQPWLAGSKQKTAANVGAPALHHCV